MPDLSPIPAPPAVDPNPEKPRPKVNLTPLSSVEFNPFSILIFNRELVLPTADPEKTEVSNEVMVQIRRAPRHQHDDVGSIPLTALPALANMLEEIAKSAMVASPLRPKPVEPTRPPPFPPRGPKKAAKSKKRR